MDLPETAWTPWGKVDLRDDEMFDGKVASWAISEIQKPHREPFFLACGFTKPHLPWIVPRKYFSLYPLNTITLPPSVSDDLSDDPSFGRRLAREVYDPSGEKDFAVHGGDHANIHANGQWHAAVQAYLATISFVDAQIGRVLEALDNSQYADNTIIVLWGDHGWHLGEKEHWRKHALWDVSTRTPLIIAGPSRIEGIAGLARGQVCDRPVSLLDVYPTLLELCCLSPRDGLDGRSLQSLLKNPEQPWDYPVVTTFGFNNHAVQTSRWRYIRYRDGGEELYDHGSDPNEWTNLAALSGHEAIITELKTRLPKENKR
jgi:arylsulfatase A-like enzyme